MIKTDKPISAVKYNGADIPLDAHPADGIVVKARNASGYITELDHYGDAIGVSQYRSVSGSAFANLTTINVKSGMVDVGNSALSGMKFTVDTVANLFPFIKSLMSYSMQSCSAITEINLPNCERIGKKGVSKSGDGCFKACSKLSKIVLPKLQFVNTGTNEDGAIAQVGSLRELIVGSIGHPYEPDQNGHFFYQQTQSDLVATFYVANATIGNNVLAIERNGAPNATIIIKDSTTGDTIVTSTS